MRRALPNFKRAEKPGDFHHVVRLVPRLRKYQRKEPREAVYQVASRIIDQCWAKRDYDMLARATAALLVSWNARVHVGRTTPFDKLPGFIERHYLKLDRLRKLDLHEESTAFHDLGLYRELLCLLKVKKKNKTSLYTPVGAAKALHILAPRYFPLWDRVIARKAGHTISMRADSYQRYGEEARLMVKRLVRAALHASLAPSEDAAFVWLREQTCTHCLSKTWVKFADEYNYVRYVLEPGEGRRTRHGSAGRQS
jgi:hypothetical protein